MSRSSLNKYMNTSRHTCPLYIYELAQSIIIAVNPYRPSIKSYSYWDVESCIFRSWREQFVYLEMMRYSHTQQLILVPSILQVRRIWPSRCRWWSGRDGSTLHQPIEVDGLCYYLEASRTPEIVRYVENDNLADIKLKLTCTNSIAAMNIYMEQMKHTVPRSKGRWIARWRWGGVSSTVYR